MTAPVDPRVLACHIAGRDASELSGGTSGYVMNWDEIARAVILTWLSLPPSPAMNGASDLLRSGAMAGHFDILEDEHYAKIYTAMNEQARKEIQP